MDLLTKRIFCNVILSPNFKMLFEEQSGIKWNNWSLKFIIRSAFFLKTKISTVPSFSGLSRNQATYVPKSRNTINLFRIKAFSSTFKENPKFLFFHSPKLFVYKLTSSSTAISTIFEYFKSWRLCLLKNSSLSVLLYLGNLILRPYAFKNWTCANILIISKNRC